MKQLKLGIMILLGCLLFAAGHSLRAQEEAGQTLHPVAVFQAGVPVESLEFSPGGNLIMLNLEDGSTILWNPDSDDHQEVRAATFYATSDEFVYADTTAVYAGDVVLDTNGVESVALSRDGQLLAASSTDGIVRVWDLSREELLIMLEGYNSPSNQLAFLPNGRVLVSSNDAEGELRFWDTQSTTPGQVLVQGYTPFEISRDGFVIGYISQGHTATVQTLSQIMAVRGEAPFAVFESHRAPVRDIAISADARRAATASEDATISLWNISRGTEEMIFLGHTGAVNAVDFSPDDRLIVSASDDGTVMLWNTSDGTPLQTMEEHPAAVRDAVFSLDGTRIASADASGNVIVWGTGEAITLPFSPDEIVNTAEPINAITGFTRRPLDAGYHPSRRGDCRIQRNEFLLAIAQSRSDGSLLVYAGGRGCEGAVWITPYDVFWGNNAELVADLPVIDVPSLSPLIRINDYEAVCEAANGRGTFADDLLPYTAYPPDDLYMDVQATVASGIDVIICHELVEVPVENCHTRGPGPNPGGVFSYIFTRLRVDDVVTLVRYDTGEIIAQRTFQGGRPPNCPRHTARGEVRGSIPGSDAWMPWVMSHLYNSPDPSLRTVVNTPTLNARDLPDPNAEILQTIRAGTPMNLIGRNAAGDWVLALTPTMSPVWVAARYLDVAIITNIGTLPVIEESAESAVVPLPSY